MTRLEFILECNIRLIAPDIALENTDVQDALSERDDERVKQLLSTEF